MKVFISWSGPLSKLIAEKLRIWLRRILPVIDPFVSSQDIEKGNDWLATVFSELNQASVSIICVTRENQHSDWLLFEAGASVKHLGQANVCTLLVNISKIELSLPLSGFQSTSVTKADMLRLLETIHSALPRKLLSDKELEEQFTQWWPEFESSVGDALKAPIQTRTEIQELAEELLLPVIYREALAGDLDTVFHWLQIAKARRIADLEGRLGFVEACLARITGKRGASLSLRQLSAKFVDFASMAYLEWLFLQFASDQSMADANYKSDEVESYPESARRTIYALFGLWCLREQREVAAEEYWKLANPERISEDPGGCYRAIPMGILCFAFGEGDLGERHFDLAKKGSLLRNEGYPFVSVVKDFDRSFVMACIGRADRGVPDQRIREVRGHAWVLAQYISVFRTHARALQTFVGMSAKWPLPIQEKTVSDRLFQFQKKLIANAGVPLSS